MSVKTAALLPTPGDAFVTRYWARNYARVWRGEVDELFVCLNGEDTSAAAAALNDVGARIIRHPRRIGHGEALWELVQFTDADVVVLLEDDAYVREPGAIREHLRRAADGEVIGSPRGGMHPLLEVAAREKWGPVVGPDTSEGHGLWPCFLFARTDILRRTDLHFEAQWWHQGQTVPGLGYRVDGTPVDTDTMTSVAFQLRDRNPISLVGQWKELWQKRLPPEGAPWFHAGGLSNLDKMPREGIGGTLEGKDWAHRIWWWYRTASREEETASKDARFAASKDARFAWTDLAAQEADVWPEIVAWNDDLCEWINWDDKP